MGTARGVRTELCCGTWRLPSVSGHCRRPRAHWPEAEAARGRKGIAALLTGGSRTTLLPLAAVCELRVPAQMDHCWHFLA